MRIEAILEQYQNLKCCSGSDCFKTFLIMNSRVHVYGICQKREKNDTNNGILDFYYKQIAQVQISFKRINPSKINIGDFTVHKTEKHKMRL